MVGNQWGLKVLNSGRTVLNLYLNSTDQHLRGLIFISLFVPLSVEGVGNVHVSSEKKMTNGSYFWNLYSMRVTTA